MNKKQIIEALYRDKQFKKVCQNIAPPSLCEDLFHETIIVFLEMEEEKVIKASSEGYLKWLFIRIASNSFNSKTSPFYHKYHHNDNSFGIRETIVPKDDKTLINSFNNTIRLDPFTNEINTKEFEEKYKQLVESIENEIEVLDFYEKELLKLYIKFGNYRDVSREVGIKYESVRHAIRLAIEKIKLKNDKLYNDMLNERVEWICNI